MLTYISRQVQKDVIQNLAAINTHPSGEGSFGYSSVSGYEVGLLDGCSSGYLSSIQLSTSYAKS